MTLLLESSWPAIVIGLLLEAALILWLIQSGRVSVIGWIAAVALATVGMVVLERVVVTEFEEVEDTLDRVASALEHNNVPDVLAYFASDSPRRGQVQSTLSRVTVREARIGGDLQVRLRRLTLPPSAVATFTGRMTARDGTGSIPYENVIRRFQITLHRQGDAWRIYDYADQEQAGAVGRR